MSFTRSQSAFPTLGLLVIIGIITVMVELMTRQLKVKSIMQITKDSDESEAILKLRGDWSKALIWPS